MEDRVTESALAIAVDVAINLKNIVDLTYVILNNLALIVLIAGYLILKNYLPSYFSEKGKYRAMKEDIKEITETVKNVEGKVNILTNSIIDYTSLKRQYIIDYFAAYNNWERTLTVENLQGYGDFITANKISIQRIYAAKYEYNLKEGEIELFIEDEEFYECRRALSVKTLESLHDFEKAASELAKLFYGKTGNPDYTNDVKNVLEKYRKQSLQNLREIFIERRKLLKLLSRYIKELME